MAITYKGIKPGGTTKTTTPEGQTYDVIHLVEVDTVAEAYEDLVETAVGLPAWGSLFPTNNYAWLKTFKTTNPNPFRGWEVLCQYTTDRGANQESKTNPLNESAEIEWDGEETQAIAPIRNSAGDPFDPPVMIDDSELIVRVQKNLAGIPAWFLTHKNAVNDAPFTIDGFSVATGQAKLKRRSASRKQIRNEIVYRAIRFEIHLNEDGWNATPLDAGFRDKDGVPFVNEDGSEVSQPVPMDGVGGELENPSIENGVYLSETVYTSRDFSVLPLS